MNENPSENVKKAIEEIQATLEKYKVQLIQPAIQIHDIPLPIDPATITQSNAPKAKSNGKSKGSK